MALRDRICAIMEEQGLTRRQMAAGLDTSPHTLKGWLDQGKTPPAALGPLIDLIERKPQVSRWLRLGTRRIKLRPRGHSFQPGNIWRIGSPTREAALREARERKAKAKD
jgi:hypothetical protein